MEKKSSSSNLLISIHMSSVVSTFQDFSPSLFRTVSADRKKRRSLSLPDAGASCARW
jgi:hypothetical protein